MGSADGVVRCKCCGMPASMSVFYHSNSHIVSCSFCGYLDYKMICYEACVPDDDPSLVDGYVIEKNDGYGVIVYREGKRFRSDSKKSDDERPAEDADVALESFVKDGKLVKIAVGPGCDGILPAALCIDNNGNYVFAAHDPSINTYHRRDAAAMKRRFENPHNRGYILTCPVEFVGCEPYVSVSDSYDDFSDTDFPPKDMRIHCGMNAGVEVVLFTEDPVKYYDISIPHSNVVPFLNLLSAENVITNDHFLNFCEDYAEDAFDHDISIGERMVRDDINDYDIFEGVISRNRALDEYEAKCQYTKFTPDVIVALKKQFSRKLRSMY